MTSSIYARNKRMKSFSRWTQRCHVSDACRNVAARDWLSKHPGGTKEEFTQYFNLLTQAQIKEKKHAADLVCSFANSSDFSPHL
jgi:hypothetical protein